MKTIKQSYIIEIDTFEMEHDDANISPLMAVRAVVLHADDFIHGLSNVPEASCPLFVEYEIPSGCL